MLDDFERLPPLRASADKPLTGLTFLVVEDSRSASEAIRLLCLRSGARVRRADSLASAHRHLAVYRPAAVIVDLGLPDGSGVDLIAELHRAAPRVPAVLGMSGSMAGEALAREAGADGFLAKPVENIAVFQREIVQSLPEVMRPRGPRIVEVVNIAPDPVALAEDLLNASDLLSDAKSSGEFSYLVHFLRGVALTAHDTELDDAVLQLERGHPPAAVTRVGNLLAARLSAAC